MKFYVVWLMTTDDIYNIPVSVTIAHFETKHDAEKFVEYFEERSDGHLNIDEVELIPENGINLEKYEKENDLWWLKD